MSKRETQKAILAETMCRLREQIAAERAGLTRKTGILALAIERMLHQDERAYAAALADYRAITHPHASAPRAV